MVIWFCFVFDIAKKQGWVLGRYDRLGESYHCYFPKGECQKLILILVRDISVTNWLSSWPMCHELTHFMTDVSQTGPLHDTSVTEWMSSWYIGHEHNQFGPHSWCNWLYVIVSLIMSLTHMCRSGDGLYRSPTLKDFPLTSTGDWKISSLSNSAAVPRLKLDSPNHVLGSSWGNPK